MAGNGELSQSSLMPDEWCLGKMIGSGSFGVVHLAINRSNGSLFVVKSSESREGNRSLENEAKILETLDSPHVVQCLGTDVSFGENGPKTNLFIEYMAAGNLGDVSEKLGGKLDERVIRLYTREILKGLKYLHDVRIVHGDVKCQNVLLGSRGNIKLADFGCAKQLVEPKLKSGATDRKFICGTPLWMAPEVLRNEEINFSADVWSLGCTVIEMATGKCPWGELGVSNPMAAILKIASSDEKPSFPKEFSKDGLDFLKKCLMRVPERRSTVDELLNHPFIKSEPKARSTQEKQVYEQMNSPLSILDVGLGDDGYESDDSDELVDMKPANKIPFWVRRYEKRGSSQKQYTENEMMSQENWVTVRI